MYGGVGRVKDTTGRSLKRSRFRSSFDPPAAAGEFASRISSRESGILERKYRVSPQFQAVFSVSFGIESELLLNKMTDGILKKSIDKTFYRNGQLREVVPLRNGRRHGVVRVWHKNGVLATEEPYENGLLHGICRQWSESGKLLGKYRMVHGTGVQRAWHENGKLQLEFSTVRGDFSGRYRLWLHDGTLLSEDIYLHGRSVTAEEYRAARAKDKSLPILNGQVRQAFARNHRHG